MIERLQGFFGFTRTPFGRDLTPSMPQRHTSHGEAVARVGVRNIHHQIVTALGGQPLVHHPTLVPQTANALATEQAERCRTPVLVIDEAHLLDHPSWSPCAC